LVGHHSHCHAWQTDPVWHWGTHVLRKGAAVEPWHCGHRFP
jgi:hypothetical protein